MTPTRRQYLAAGGALGIAAFAGCTAKDADRSDFPTRPTPPPMPDDQYWAFVIASLDYQNKILARAADDEGWDDGN